MQLDRRSLLLRGAGAAAGLGLTSLRISSEAAAASDRRLAALRRVVDGPVIGRANRRYGHVGLPFNERYDGVHPLGVVQPVSVADIRQIVAWSRRTGVRLAVRSGGHSYAGYSTTTGLVVDLSRLSSVTVDPASGVATVGAGALLVDVETALAAHGRAIPSGSCATVGIGGLALGGGVGFASRAFGTTSDNVVGLGIVTADGRYRACSATRSPDLFWACRGGGGGNFGIVTHFELRTHPVANVSFFFARWPWSQAAEVVREWLAFAPHAPDGLFSVVTASTGVSGPSIGCIGQLLGHESKLRRLVAPLAGVDGLTLTVGTSSYLDAQLRWAGCLGKSIAECRLAAATPTGTLGRDRFTAKSDYVTEPLGAVARGTITTWIERAQAEGFGSAALLLDSYGGALNRPAPDATAFVHRDSLCSAQYLAYWGRDSAEPRAKAWIRGFHAAMRPAVSGFAYQNYIDPELAGWEHAYYGGNYPRLREVKASVDPDRLFHFAQGIRPA